MVTLNSIFVLLIVFQLKHFIADYPLQGKYMLKKFASGTEWILPLLAHTGVHAVMTFAIALVFGASLSLSVLVTLLDMSLHFLMDRIKASPDMLGRFKPLTAETYFNSTDKQKRSNVLFWWSLGLDQGVHHLTHYLIIYLLVSK